MAKTDTIFVLVYGRKLIAAFYNRKNAEVALEVMKQVIPSAYPVKPRIEKVQVQG